MTRAHDEILAIVSQHLDSAKLEVIRRALRSDDRLAVIRDAFLEERDAEAVNMIVSARGGVTDLIGTCVRLVSRSYPEELRLRGIVRGMIADSRNGVMLVIEASEVYVAPWGLGALRVGSLVEISLMDESTEVAIDRTARRS